jgi:116 kDa U5 small nuclear ribonucleoprotein component
LIDAIVKYFPSPQGVAAEKKTNKTYSGKDAGSKIVSALKSCDPKGPLMVQCVKCIHRPALIGDEDEASSGDAAVFDVLGRVMSGTLYAGQSVKVLGESFVPDDNEEDSAIKQVTKLWIPQPR